MRQSYNARSGTARELPLLLGVHAARRRLKTPNLSLFRPLLSASTPCKGPQSAISLNRCFHPESAGLSLEIEQRMDPSHARMPQPVRPGVSHDMTTAPLGLEVRKLKTEVNETQIEGCVTWALSAKNFAKLRERRSTKSPPERHRLPENRHSTYRPHHHRLVREGHQEGAKAIVKRTYGVQKKLYI